jgi:hypothetical protein
MMTADVHITDGEFISTTSTNQMDAYTLDTSAETIDSVVSIDSQDVWLSNPCLIAARMDKLCQKILLLNQHWMQRLVNKLI